MSHLAGSIMSINSRPNKWPVSRSDSPPPRVGDVVLALKEDDNAGETWTLAKIKAISEDGRKLELLAPKPGGESLSTIIQSVRNCALITSEDSVPINSKAYFQLYHNTNYDATV